MKHKTPFLILLFFLLFSGGSYTMMKTFSKAKHSRLSNPTYSIRKITQTGPQKNALKTDVLAELLDLSADNPTNLFAFDTREGKAILEACPLIEEATLKRCKPDRLYIDYTLRQPVAFSGNHLNMAYDVQGNLFPFSPFFTPKHLPTFYFGDAPKEKALSLALTLYSLIASIEDPFILTSIDVSNAFAPTLGTRECVITLDIHRDENTTFTHLLRLSSSTYEQDLGNYLSLKIELDIQEKEQLTLNTPYPTTKVIDLRLADLAYIQEL